MGRMNFEIPDEINKELDNESREKNVPKKMIIIETLRQRYRDMDRLDWLLNNYTPDAWNALAEFAVTAESPA